MAKSYAKRVSAVLFAGASLLMACFPSRSSAAELKVVVTIRPVHSLVSAVMDGVGEPRLLIDGNASPHTFTMKPSDAKALHDATVIFRVAESIEPFTTKLAKSLPASTRMVTLEAVPGLTRHELRTGAAFEAHSHGREGGRGGHAHRHSHASARTGLDGHVWLDPDNAVKIADHVAETLAQLAPAHGPRLRANAASLRTRIEALTPAIDAQLRPLAAKRYVVFHDAYQYFEQRFGLSPVGSVTVSPDVSPSAKRLTELRSRIRDLKAVCVFAEPQFEPKLVATVVEGMPLRRGVLDPLGAAIPAGPEQYFGLLRALATDLATCLADPA